MENHKGVICGNHDHDFLCKASNMPWVIAVCWHLKPLRVPVIPLPPCSLKYLIHISSVILTTVQPESGDGKYNPLDTEGLECAWKIQCAIDLHAECMTRVLCTAWELLSNLYMASYLLLGMFSIERRENKNSTVYCWVSHHQIFSYMD